MSGSAKIDIAYCGVHQAYQLALAAHEIDQLKNFYCSVYNGPGKWGLKMAKILGNSYFRNRHLDGIPLAAVKEYPIPLLLDLVRRKMGSHGEGMSMFQSFDNYTAKLVRTDSNPADLLVTTERCALKSLQTAKSRGIYTVHDCPQLHPVYLEELMNHAAELAKMHWQGFPDGENMKERKLQEYENADRLLIYSDIHRRSFVKSGIPEAKLFECPLWVDQNFWQPDSNKEFSTQDKPLRLLFVGEYSLRKGLPFLFKALENLEAPVQLTLVGKPTQELVVPQNAGSCSIEALGPLSKSDLKKEYSRHDLLVLPSVADSFGFVALEAMAFGMPVILTENCGAPVPQDSWKVPAMDIHALAEAITKYNENRTLLEESSEIARKFAGQFTPRRYRKEIGGLFKASLAA
jgi:glycosyltransferase involved in cell wall biosynthesis